MHVRIYRDLNFMSGEFFWNFKLLLALCNLKFN